MKKRGKICIKIYWDTPLWGDSGLPSLGITNQDAIGNENTLTGDNTINVIVSGWQVYNNKGLVVEKYEPFFDIVFDYAQPTLAQTGEKARMYYDPRGQLIKTLNPDDSMHTVFFGTISNLTQPENFLPSPWEHYTYDANDNAGRRAAGAGGTDSSHFNTPERAVIDALGRVTDTYQYLDSAGTDSVHMQYCFDIRGNLLEVTDALSRTAFLHKYDLKPKMGEKDKGANALYTSHIDGGEKYIVLDGLMRSVESRDAKGALVLNTYDLLHRPLSLLARDNDTETITMRHHIIYGDQAHVLSPPPITSTDAYNANLLGKPYRTFDEAGVVETDSFDFKGNLLHKVRHCISNATLIGIYAGSHSHATATFRANWTSLVNPMPTSILDSPYEIDINYDGLNRILQMTLPHDVLSTRKVITPTYNTSGGLQQVKIGSDVYVKEIAYNAKGQRLLVAYGNDVMTRYRYNKITLRLERTKTESYTNTTTNTYHPTSGTTLQDLAYEYDLHGNIIGLTDSSPDAGVGGIGDLIRDFEYDPIYRLLSATGRENGPATGVFNWDDYSRSDTKASTVDYTQYYTYDKMGNMQQLQHISGGTGLNFTRNFNYNSGFNTLNNLSGPGTPTYEYDLNGNIIHEGMDRYMQWDATDRMRAFAFDKSNGGSTFEHTQYLYDAGGQRIKKISRSDTGSTFVAFTYIDGIFEHQEWLNSSGSMTDENNYLHVMDNKTRIAQLRIGPDLGDNMPSAYYILSDNVDSSNVTFDNIYGTTLTNEEYYPFGESSFGYLGRKRFRFSGKERDEESSFYFYGLRYYMPWICRFVSVDPLAEKYPYYTPYQYAGNKPINFIDLDGGEEKDTSSPVVPVKDSSAASNQSDTTATQSDTAIVKTQSTTPQTQSSATQHNTIHNGGGKYVKALKGPLFPVRDPTKEFISYYKGNKSNTSSPKTENLTTYQTLYLYSSVIFGSANPLPSPFTSSSSSTIEPIIPISMFTRQNGWGDCFQDCSRMLANFFNTKEWKRIYDDSVHLQTATWEGNSLNTYQCRLVKVQSADYQTKYLRMTYH